MCLPQTCMRHTCTRNCPTLHKRSQALGAHQRNASPISVSREDGAYKAGKNPITQRALACNNTSLKIKGLSRQQQNQQGGSLARTACTFSAPRFYLVDGGAFTIAGQSQDIWDVPWHSCGAAALVLWQSVGHPQHDGCPRSTAAPWSAAPHCSSAGRAAQLLRKEAFRKRASRRSAPTHAAAQHTPAAWCSPGSASPPW